ncbi:hypothetical protein AB205_0207610 [Aquarana catesbeiana]|uniref:MADF domain-containing protein n=1 Tax=Aquarana catesbeiana TaxID=8400 RepID=A0A2G9RWV7_AQUCT|nr:hypothetical protein AB205_0207610 [Aquarana catesbeiana]
MDILKDQDFMPIFIDMFRELPCLWQINHSEYKNQTKRKAALDKLLQFVKSVIPTADIIFLKILIGGLRSTYLREYKKVQDSQRSGAADDIYVPRLWYYNRLHFLAGQTEPRPALSTLPSTLPSTSAEASDVQPGPSRQQHVEEPSLSQGSLSQEVAGPSRLPNTQVPPLRLQRQSGRKRSNLEAAAIGLFWKDTEALRTPHSVEEDFAGLTACKMMEMEEGEQLLCEFLILEALNKGLRGQIKCGTHICDLTHGPPPPPPSGPTPPPPGPTPPPATSPTPQPQPERKHGRKTRE